MLSTASSLERQAAVLSQQIHDLRIRKDAAAAVKRSAVEMAAEVGIALDPWQVRALSTEAKNILLLCARQAGKSTVAALLALQQAVYEPGSLILIVSPGERQSKRLLRTIRKNYGAFRAEHPSITEGILSLELVNGSEIHALPGSEATIRGFSSVDLLILDEGALVEDDLYLSVRPMLAISNGRLLALSTPRGKRGFFHREWTEGGEAWHREKVTAYDVPRIDRAWLEEERRRIGEFWFLQEFMCEFLDSETQLFASDLIQAALSPTARSFGLPMFGKGT